MTQENKELLLKDLCARLLYGVNLSINGEKAILYGIDENTVIALLDGWDYKEEFIVSVGNDVDEIKPYLRPMPSMNEDEKNKFQSLQGYFYGEKYIGNNEWENTGIVYYNTVESLDWLNANHFDYRHLIEKGLAIIAPKDMYK